MDLAGVIEIGGEHSRETELNKYQSIFAISRTHRIVWTCAQRAFFLRLIRKRKLSNWDSARQSVYHDSPVPMDQNVFHQPECYGHHQSLGPMGGEETGLSCCFQQTGLCALPEIKKGFSEQIQVRLAPDMGGTEAGYLAS